ncbi:3'-5' exonuclease domain [Dillenia turbinata]|uniref:3'-5' exonuclease domain n=1 Tax=Dillenia turbinata TaxID=194707 RepID=A0AAN8ZRT8_9MAGN
MEISIEDCNLGVDTHELFQVSLIDDQIRTIVTHTPSIVDEWIINIERMHRRRLRHLVVGLDIEWRPNFNRYIQNPVAILQLCVGHHCLIFQLLYTRHIPQSLLEFLSCDDYTFVGVNIESDVEKLCEDHNLEVSNVVDLRDLAADELERGELRNAGLKGLARAVLGREIEKPKRVTMSRWDNEWLTYDQVQYACVDAFLSFEIGRALNAVSVANFFPSFVLVMLGLGALSDFCGCLFERDLGGALFCQYWDVNIVSMLTMLLNAIAE